MKHELVVYLDSDDLFLGEFDSSFGVQLDSSILPPAPFRVGDLADAIRSCIPPDAPRCSYMEHCFDHLTAAYEACRGIPAKSLTPSSVFRTWRPRIFQYNLARRMNRHLPAPPTFFKPSGTRLLPVPPSISILIKSLAFFFVGPHFFLQYEKIDLMGNPLPYAILAGVCLFMGLVFEQTTCSASPFYPYESFRALPTPRFRDVAEYMASKLSPDLMEGRYPLDEEIPVLLRHRLGKENGLLPDRISMDTKIELD